MLAWRARRAGSAAQKQPLQPEKPCMQTMQPRRTYRNLCYHYKVSMMWLHARAQNVRRERFLAQAGMKRVQ